LQQSIRLLQLSTLELNAEIDQDPAGKPAAETQAAATSLREHLGAQVGLTQMADRERALVAFLIEALDDDGYLTQPLDELVDLLVGPKTTICAKSCSKNSASPCATCRTSTRPASVRATRRNA
jgi:DNA-directed RNA polymerase specialized sigma54-like protein